MSAFNVVMIGGEAADGRLLRLVGDDFEQGRQHGAAVGDLMRRNLEVVRRQLARHGTEKLASAYREATHFVQTHQPRVWQEYEGMAEGSGLPFEDILTLNLKVASVLGWLDVECSQYAKVVRRADGSTRTLIAKTRDQKGGPIEHVVLDRNYPDGHTVLEVQKAGIISYPGSAITVDGFAMGTSGVWSARTPFERDRLAEADIGPSTRDVLDQSRSLADIPAILARQPRLTGINYMVARPGELGAVEVTAKESRYIPGPQSGMVRTNHYLTAEFADLSPRPDETTSTFSRFARITEMLEGVTDEADMWAIAQDHKSYPQDSVCRHLDGVEKGSFTTYASVFVLEERKAIIGLGNPCGCTLPA